MGISVWQLLIVLLIIVLLFGTKKLRSIGKDMGGAVRGFRDAMGEEEKAGTDKSRDKTSELAHQEGSELKQDETVVQDKDKDKV